MRRLDTLTLEEQEFATDQHPLVTQFLRVKRLTPADYYDIVVFGFLEAVQQYYRNPIPSEKQNFSALAFICMEHSVGEDWKYRLRSMRRGDPLSLDFLAADSEEDFSFYAVLPDKIQNTEKQVEDRDLMNRVMAVGTKREVEAVNLACQGYGPIEISQIMGVSRDTGRTTLYHFRQKARAVRENREVVNRQNCGAHQEPVRTKHAGYHASKKT